MLLAGLGQKAAKDSKLRGNNMKMLARYEYHGYHIDVYEDGTCDITDVWDGELVDGEFENNKQAERYITGIILDDETKV